MDEPGIADTATSFGVPLRFFGPDTLEAETPRLANRPRWSSGKLAPTVSRKRLLWPPQGRKARLLHQKLGSLVRPALSPVQTAPSKVTSEPDGATLRLSVLALAKKPRSGEAAQQLRDAEDIVGFKAYFDLIEDLPLSGDIHAFEIGAESDRVRKAFDLAATGRRVALICSGDAGIYAMAALAFEMLDETTRSDWRRISIEVAPGISAP